MSNLWLSSDLHLGHKNVLKFRPEFKTLEEHDQTILENLKMSVNKRDSLYLLGDVAFTEEMLMEIDEIKCVKKTLILGNHDTDQGIPFDVLVHVFNSIHALHSRRNVWFTHCPIHHQFLRGKKLVIHGHTHREIVQNPENHFGYTKMVADPRYINVCVEQTDYKPITFNQVTEGKIEY